MQDYKTEKINVALSWSFIGQSILALLDCNTNIKPKDRELVRGLLVDMASAGDKGVDACELLKTVNVTVEDRISALEDEWYNNKFSLHCDSPEDDCDDDFCGCTEYRDKWDHYHTLKIKISSLLTKENK
jgi:hypothetical protein